MPELGATYRCNVPPRHIWVIISEPSQHDGNFVLVNFTTFKEGSVDETCILQPEDYRPFLTRATTVAYSRFKFGSAEGMETLLKNGQFHEMPPIPTATLKKVIHGALMSPELPRAAKLMLPSDGITGSRT
jgi:hypothetical protein